MKRVVLFTRDGRYVTALMIPEFTPMPEVLLWGERTFMRVVQDWRDGSWQYYEALCYVVPPETGARP